MKIAGLEIGHDTRPLVVAELGAAHNGSLETALQLIREAKKAGADMFKVQCFTPDTISANFTGPEFIIRDGPWSGRSLYALYQEAHTPRSWFPYLFIEAAKVDIPLFASVFSIEDIEFIKEFDPPAYKIASFELVDPILIAAAVETGKPVIISTGMGNWDEISTAARVTHSWNTIWLHCISSYPAPVAGAHLSGIRRLRRQFDYVGFSDHTIGHAAAMMAVAIGAKMIEKHITLTPDGDGLDDHFAIGPGAFAEFCHAIKDAWLAQGEAYAGDDREQVGTEHAPLRRSLYVVKSINKGEMFTVDNVRSIRPGAGMAPKFFSEVMGMKASLDVAAGTPLHADMIESWSQS